MTLRTDYDFPLPEDIKERKPEDFGKYIKKLVDSLEDMYQDVAQNVNGSMRQWTPTVYGTTTPGDTITYVRQVGWLRRSGIVTELWMDVAWSFHNGTGGVAILMPYQAAKSEGNPWVGVIESVSNFFSPGYSCLTWNCTPDTTEGLIMQYGNGVSTFSFQLREAGGLRGYIRYIGQEFENT